MRNLTRSLILAASALLAGCAMTPAGGSLYEAAHEMGNTYAFDQAQGVYACASLFQDCFKPEKGSFTVDDAAIQTDNHAALIHLAFDDGRTGWMAYNDFLARKFAAPVATNRQIRLGTTQEEITAQWGQPDTVEPKQVGRATVQIWKYAKGTLRLAVIEEGKVSEFGLRKSLLAP